MRTSHDGRAASLNPRMTGHSSIEAATAERPEAVADSQDQELPGGGGKRAAGENPAGLLPSRYNDTMLEIWPADATFRPDL